MSKDVQVHGRPKPVVKADIAKGLAESGEPLSMMQQKPNVVVTNPGVKALMNIRARKAQRAV